MLGDSAYRRVRERHGDDADAFYEYLREHRLDDTSLCLGFYLERAKREMNLNQTDVAERTRTATEEPIMRSFLSLILGGRSGIRADTWVRIADALDANPLEFFIAEGWVEQRHIAAYTVPSSRVLLPIANKLEQIPVELQQAAVTMIASIVEVVLLRQFEVRGR